MVEYTYDPWGKPLATTPRQLPTDIPPEDGETEEQTAERLALIDRNTRLNNLYQSLATLNPFRYRGYVYDEETKLYYLRTRYYNPEWGRFVNEDSLIGVTGKLLSHNVFAYCENRPLQMVDTDGNEGESLHNRWDNAIEESVKMELLQPYLQSRRPGLTKIDDRTWGATGPFGIWDYKISLLYSEEQIRLQSDVRNGQVGYYRKFSLVNMSGSIDMGIPGEYDMDLKLKGVLDIGTVQGSAFFNSEYYSPCISGKAAVASGRVTVLARYKKFEGELGMSGDVYAVGGTIDLAGKDLGWLDTSRLDYGLIGYTPFQIKPVARIKIN